MFLLEETGLSEELEPLKRLVDGALVEQAKLGDQAACDQLYRRYSQLVFGMIFRITKNVEDTEDAAQDTFCRAFRNLHGFDGRAQFATWLTRIAINSALMVIRKRSRRLEISIDANHDDDEFVEIQLEDPYPNPELAYLRSESVLCLRNAVQRLPRTLREVAELRCTHDLTLRNIAELRGISLAAAKSRLLRAGTKLHSRLGSGRQGHLSVAKTQTS